MFTIEEIEKSTADLPLIGYTAFWRLGGIRVRHGELKAALAAAGFGSYLPDPPTARIALRRAIVDWIGARAAAGEGPALVADEAEAAEGPTTQRALLRVINQKGSEWLAFALVAEDVDFRKLGLHHGTSLRIILHKKTRTMYCTTTTNGVVEAGEESKQITRELGPHWDQYKDLLLSGDLSRMMRNIIGGMGAISLRREGGLYFVPVAERDALERLRGLLAALPSTSKEGTYLCAMGVIDRAQARRQLAAAVHQSFIDELGVLRTDLQRFTDAKTGTVKPETISERLASYKRIKAKVQTYADLLEMQQERIVSELDDLTALARTVVMQDSEDEDDGGVGFPPPPPAPPVPAHQVV